jgi:hypothetical protein
MAKGSGSRKTALVPDRVRRLTLLGPPPLIEGEDAAAYGANSSIEFPLQSNPRTFWKKSGSGTSSTWCGRHCGGAG